MRDTNYSLPWFGFDPQASPEELILSLEKLVQVFNLSPELMTITTLSNGVYIDVNLTFLETMGYQRDEIIGKKSTDIGIWVSAADREQAMRDLLNNLGRVRGREIIFQNRRGQLGTGLWSGDIIMIGGEKCVVSSLLDITDRKQTEESLRKSEQLFRLLAENARDIIYRVSLRPRRVEYISPSIQSITGYTPEDHYNNPWLIFDIIHPEDRQTLLKPANMYNEEPMIIRWITREGKIIWTEQKNRIIYDTDRQAVALEGIARDITERVNFEEYLRHTSLHDALTSIYNRAYFEEELRRQDTNRQNNPIAIIACDVDGLKLFNDIMGHAEGDRIIKAAAGVLETSFRQGDVVARVGGDEFAVIVTPATKTLVIELCTRVTKGVREYNFDTTKVPLSLSIGYALRPNHEVSLDEVYREADAEMYRHKIRHRKRYRQQLLKSMAQCLERPVYDSKLDRHIDQIKMAAGILAHEMKLSRKRTELLMRLADFHDIGLAGLPPELLAVTRELAESEWTLLKQHPDNGYRIAAMVPELNQLADGIWAHHENWDGSGYPRGLMGNKIPLESRIIRIADTFSALTCDSIYQMAIKDDLAIDELQTGAGSRFDPDLVTKFINGYQKRQLTAAP
ncbi:MAG: diguanylate cyclase [Methylocystaceae bacterium]